MKKQFHQFTDEAEAVQVSSDFDPFVRVRKSRHLQLTWNEESSHSNTSELEVCYASRMEKYLQVLQVSTRLVWTSIHARQR